MQDLLGDPMWMWIGLAGAATPEQQALVEEAVAAAVQARGLPLDPVPEVRFVDAEAYVAESAESSVEEFGGEELLLSVLAGVQMAPTALEERVENLALAHYSPETRQVVVRAWIEPASIRAVLIHELVHAIDDQHYDLQSFYDHATTADEAFARLCVIEGSAMLASGEVGSEALPSAEPDVPFAYAAPVYALLDRRLTTPYTLGPEYVAGLEDREAGYTHPPESSAEVMHPGVARPMFEVNLPVVAGWEVVTGDVLGAFGVATLAEHSVATHVVASTRGGRTKLTFSLAPLPTVDWAGDAWQVWRRGEERAAVMVVVLQTPEDADHLVRALDIPAPHAILERGTAVTIVAAPDDRTARKLARQVSSKTRIAPR